MKAMIFTGNSQAEIREVPTPEPVPGYVLVKMKAAGLCGSDLHGVYELTKEGIEGRNRGLGRDMIPGHEPCGVIEDMESEVHGLTVGDRVIVNPWVGCGVCRMCRAGWAIYVFQKKLPAVMAGALMDALLIIF